MSSTDFNTNWISQMEDSECDLNRWHISQNPPKEPSLNGKRHRDYAKHFLFKKYRVKKPRIEDVTEEDLLGCVVEDTPVRIKAAEDEAMLEANLKWEEEDALDLAREKEAYLKQQEDNELLVSRRLNFDTEDAMYRNEEYRVALYSYTARYHPNSPHKFG